MSAPPLCSFCDRINPTGAKFCNACGSPLNLKPCTTCDAVNPAAAAVCYSCGADLVEPALEMVGADEGSALCPGAPGARENKPLPESAADILALLPVPRVRDAREHAEPGERDVLRVASDARARVVDGAWNAAHPHDAAAGGAALLGHRTLGTALLIGLFVVAFTLLALYGYRHPAGVGNWLDHRKVAAGFLPNRPTAVVATDVTATRESRDDIASDAPATVPVEVPRATPESNDASPIDALAIAPVDAGTAASAPPATPPRARARREGARQSPAPTRERPAKRAEVARCTDAIAALALCASGAGGNAQ